MPTGSLLAVFIFSALVSFGAVISPGPVSATVLAESPRQGWRVGPLVSTGHALLELIMVLLLALGLSSPLSTPGVKSAIALVGGVLLVIMGAGYVTASARRRITLEASGHAAGLQAVGTLFSLGMLATLSNPFWYAWGVTVAAGYLGQARAPGLAAVAAFYLGHISVDYGWNTLLALMAGAGRRWLSGPRYLWLVALTGLFMVYLGVTFILAAFAL
jgi:threonine/homoserine/homoserine lactone efflux protein